MQVVIIKLIINVWLTPVEIVIMAVDPAPAAAVVPVVPESTADDCCTVVAPRVVVTVIRAKHIIVVVTERITNVTRVPGYQQRVVGCLTAVSYTHLTLPTNREV